MQTEDNQKWTNLPLPHYSSTSHRLSRSFSIDSTRTVIGYLPDNEPQKRAKSNSRRLICLWMIALVVIAGLAILLFNSIASRRHHPNSTTLAWKHCGSSPTEARQNDCVYDFIAGAFVPRACFHTEVVLPRPALSRCRIGTGMETYFAFSRSRAARSRSILASCRAVVSWLLA
ncbi:hypothetical protein DL95DRAFT_390931, partial [Leptodontidium sp. 2 PMI_412]